jgi:hypothetical protein
MLELDGRSGRRGREGLLVDSDGYFMVSVLMLRSCDIDQERSALAECRECIIRLRFAKTGV